ncbi:ABC transporter substrate-binding protein [Actinacidiphila rubida]|uniref:ABC transporter substrate-binding protein n=1 Tax=Actinacidiphila rubida TaxID=310780 RepID=UPI0009459D55|nr:ABC transporter substrate-binding protein [Actinacidiphila rubida]
MTQETDGLEPAFRVPRARRRRWPWIGLALVVVAAAVTTGIRLAGGGDGCGHGVPKAGPAHECIGVTDGSTVFEPSLAPVMAKIRAENARVAAAGRPWVSVAYVEPITTDPQDEATKYGIREELEGAYLAQRQLNDAQLGGRGDTPQVKLLVANIGTRSEQWKPLTDRLIAMTTDGSRLVAVAGFGQSRGGTLDAVRALRAAKVPMMGATVTADNLASATQVGFFRTSAPNSAQASAAVNYLRQKQRATPGYQVLVIRDRNQDDIYNTSLYDDFVQAAGKASLKLVDGDLEYVSGVDGISNAFSSVADRVCDKKPAAVYFAGRGVNLRAFITAMSAPDRRCPVTVLTGDDAIGVYPDSATSQSVRDRFTASWKASGVTALYTALGHPELPARLYPAARDPFPGFVQLYHDEFGAGPDNFQDGQAMLAHDALWTLGVAIRDAAGDGTATVNAGSTLNALVSAGSVAGLSGPIELGSDGNPRNKPMALVRLEPSGTYTFIGVVRP